MTLSAYFENLLARVEASEISNQGKDANGFFSPTRTLLLRHLQLLKDLHATPGARPMVKDAWKFVVEHLPPDWLVMPAELKSEMKKILA